MNINNLYKIFKNSTFHYLFGEIFSRALDFFMLLYLAAYLNLEDYGLVSVSYAIMPIFLLFFTLNIPASLIIYYFSKKINYKRFVYSNFIFLILNSLFISSILLILQHLISDYINLPVDLVVLTILLALLRAFYEFFKEFLHSVNKSILYLLLTIGYHLILNSLIIIILSISTINLYLTKINSDILSLIFINSITIFFFLLWIKKSRNLKFDFSSLKLSISYGFPLLLGSIGNYLISQVNRVIVNSFSGPTEAGLYSFIFNISSIFLITILALNRGWLNFFYENINNNKLIKERINVSLVNFFAFAGLFTFASVVGIDFLPFSLIKFKDSLKILPVVILTNMVIYIYIFYSNYLFYFKKTFVISRNTIFSALLNLILGIVLYQFFNYQILFYTSFLAYFFLLVLHYYSAKKYNPINLRTFFTPLILLIFYNVVILIIHNHYFIEYKFVINLIILFLYLYFLYLYNRKIRYINYET